MSNNTSHVVSIQDAFDTAIQFAESTFLKDLPFQLKNGQSSEMGVKFNPQSNNSILYVATSSQFLSTMAAAMGNYHDAWILTLAHEKGHILLNQICFLKGLDPDDANNQLAAIGIQLTDAQKKWIPDFHKESAIEAYCDATTLTHAQEYFPTKWSLIAQKMLTLREETSAQFKRSTLNQSYGDEYFCAIPISYAMQQGAPISPLQAAQIAFISSIKHTPLHTDIANAVQISLDQLFEQINPSLPKIINTGTHAALGRLSAGIDNFSLKLSDLRNHQAGIAVVPPRTPKI